LESGYRVEIVGLIVGQGCRRRGIGRALVQKAERWALEIGSQVLVVRSNTKRVESHDFYAALDFNATKTQAVYRKQLTKEPRRGGVLGATLALLAMVLFSACHAPTHSGTAAGTESPSLAGQYVFSTADLRIDLYLRPDATYYAAMDAWANTTSERGVWHNQGEDIILKSEQGELRMSMRRLSPVRRNGETFYRIVDPDTEIRRAIVFRREGPSGPI
jgi:4-amino-4-deoxy-L-arabinose transferase-like glycosyltransferase